MTGADRVLFQQSKIGEFVGDDSRSYYEANFERINNSKRLVLSWNFTTFLLGPIWYGIYRIYSWALVFTVVEAFAIAQIGRGLWGDLTKSIRDRIETITIQLDLRLAQLESAKEAGSDNVPALERNIDGLQSMIALAEAEMKQASEMGLWLLLLGATLFLAIRVVQATMANPVLVRRFTAWLSETPMLPPKSIGNIALSIGFVLVFYTVNLAHFAFAVDVKYFVEFPRDPQFRTHAVAVIEGIFNFLTIHGDGLFDAISIGIRIVLDFLETLFVQTPWPVISVLIVAITALSANRMAALTAAIFLALIGSVGLWTLAMQTLALLGTAACISIGIGIPLGIYSAKRPQFYRLIRPILDMQQTIPTFVYMIPVIAFFGTGKSAAVVTCLIFGMPPVVRLTVLGIQGVPDSIREAAIAYGASDWFLLTRVEVPLAAPSIRAGINQTILLSLLTVVVASLIGAKGLGEDVLEALQYASIGQGLLAGLAILFLAKILDRIFRGDRDGV